MLFCFQAEEGIRVTSVTGVQTCALPISSSSGRRQTGQSSEPESCGNGIRCFARFVYDRKKTAETMLTVETLGGVQTQIGRASCRGGLQTMGVCEKVHEMTE